jgi:Histone chaperone domain CHZ
MVGLSCWTLLNGVDMAEIDLTNIVSRRTRGKKIDYAKEAAAAANELEDDDEEDEEYVSAHIHLS